MTDTGTGFRAITLEEALAEPPEPLRSGKVRINDTEPPSIDLDTDSGGVYWVEIARLQTPEEVLDGVAQVHGKTWVTDEMFRDFIELLDRGERLRPWPKNRDAEKSAGGHR